MSAAVVCCQNFLQVFPHIVKLFVNVANASVQARQVCSVNASWFARSKAATESANGAVAAGHPLSKNQDPFLNFMELCIELRSHGIDRQDVAAAFGQFVQIMG
jgi:hypothetical protein